MEGGNPDEEDAAQKATRLAARAARFNKSAPGQRNKDVSIRYITRGVPYTGDDKDSLTRVLVGKCSGART